MKKPILFIDKTNLGAPAEKILKELMEGIQKLDLSIEEIQTKDFNKFETGNLILCFNGNSPILSKAMSKGVVPVIIGNNNPKIKEYNPITEQGNSFQFNSLNKWEVFSSIVRALESYKFPYDWKNIVRQLI